MREWDGGIGGKRLSDADRHTRVRHTQEAQDAGKLSLAPIVLARRVACFVGGVCGGMMARHLRFCRRRESARSAARSSSNTKHRAEVARQEK